jgi:hypothetical protein
VPPYLLVLLLHGKVTNSGTIFFRFVSSMLHKDCMLLTYQSNAILLDAGWAIKICVRAHTK